MQYFLKSQPKKETPCLTHIRKSEFRDQRMFCLGLKHAGGKVSKSMTSVAPVQ